MCRPDISKLNKNRSIYLKVGFIVSLSVSILAFNWTTYPVKETSVDLKPIELDDSPEIIRTPPETTPELPPPAFDTKEIIDVEVPEFVDELPPEPIKKEIMPSDEKPVVIPKIIKPMAQPTKVKPPIVVPDEPVIDVPEILDFAEEMPRFNGCESINEKGERKMCSDKKMLEFIYKYIKYPAIARENGIEGTAYIRFVVDEEGKIGDIEVVREPGGGCGEEAARVVKLMPKWIPGKQRGTKVKVRYNLPVKFRLD